MIGADDRLLILELVTRADDCATRRDAAAYVALFTPDGVMAGAQGDYRGTAAIRAAVAAVWAGEAPGTRHLTVAPLLSPGPGTGVTVLSTLLLVTTDPPALAGLAAIRQVVVPGPDGWRIASRTIA